jgi:HK97 family phage portal protein
VGFLFSTAAAPTPEQSNQFAPEPTIPAYPGAGVGSTSSVSVRSVPDLALAIGAVWACVGLHGNTISQMPLEAYRKGPEVPEKLATQPQILVKPFGSMTQSQWLHQLVYSLLLRGNGFGRITERDGMGFATQIQLLHPDAVTVEQNDDGSLKYLLATRTGQKTIPTYDMWHILGMTPPGGLVGLSPIGWAAATLDLSRGAQKFAGDYLQGGGIPKAVVQSNQQITQTQAQTIKERLVAATRNREPIALGDGLTYQQIQIKPNEAQFLETIGATDTQVARFFFTPPAMIGAPEGSSMTYSNREQRALDFRVFGVGFWMKRIEDAFSTLLPARQYVKFDESVLLRTDVETDAKVDVQLVAGHVVAPSEIRTKRGMAPMTAAQKEESGLVPLEVTPAGTPKAVPGVTSIPNDPNASKEAPSA